MNPAYVLIFGTIVLLSISVVAVFGWAIRSGQFSDFQSGSTSIFDDDEPLGEMTDWFPDEPAIQPDGHDEPVTRIPPPGAGQTDANL